MKGMPLDGIPPYWFTLEDVTGKHMDEFIFTMTPMEAHARIENYNEHGNILTNEIVYAIAQTTSMLFNANRGENQQPSSPNDYIPRKINNDNQQHSSQSVAKMIRSQFRF